MPATNALANTAGRAIVIGCGGVLGIAWSIGLIAGLAREGANVQSVGLWVGASAGSVVAAKLACGFAIDELLEEQINGTASAHEVLRSYSQAEVDGKNQVLFEKVCGDLIQARQHIGAWALRSNTPLPEERRAIIAQRLHNADWPDKPLRIVSVNAHDGTEKIWDRSSGVTLVDAVAASCAVPGVWPPVQLQGEHFIDGGLRSMTNADLAIGARHVLVISPQGYSDSNPVSGHLRDELKALQASGSQVQVIAPDAASLKAIGSNILAPSRCAHVAAAGLHQGHALCSAMSAFWALSNAQPNLIDPITST
ncbi:patatin-like phospholipase family protein [Comamonas sp.]|uniref:patatin-like phospholipase family protein n=1 Tax=Comamonas sp. TaxID=34028 RepID=UPI0025899295|nr:patatin-like phospholipase family protein [Comamonas sp.]